MGLTEADIVHNAQCWQTAQRHSIYWFVAGLIITSIAVSYRNRSDLKETLLMMAGMRAYKKSIAIWVCLLLTLAGTLAAFVIRYEFCRVV
jgi:hypothetical protein